MEELNITYSEAKEKYGIICRHSRMPNNELRFRLIKDDDGASYIRTESSLEGGWQNSHYHTKVQETYIVQAGWIVYAELLDDKPKFIKYQDGECFTTKPFLIHNIYMPAKSIIHTVKHGDADGEDRIVNEKTKEFTKLTKDISESELKDISSNQYMQTIIDKFKVIEDYSEAYRHFDNLIWQVTAWSSGIFAVVIGGTSQLSSNNLLVNMTGIPLEYLILSLYLFFFFFISVLSYALFRFRYHQIRIKNYISQHSFKSPQVWLQLVVNMQAFILFIISVLLWDISNYYLLMAISLLIMSFLIVTYLMEKTLRQHASNVKAGKDVSITRS